MSAVGKFEMCLYDQTQRDSAELGYLWDGDLADFALLQNDGTLRVLYMDVKPVWVSGYLYWCGSIDKVERFMEGNSGTFFPVVRSEEASNTDVYSDQAKTLAYVLSGFFLALLGLYSCLLIKNFMSFKTVLGMAVPALFLLLCVFRAVFFLLWAQESFEDNEVAEYIIFETPTFLLFFLLLILIVCWKTISAQKANPNFQPSNKSNIREIILSGLVLLIYISIVVASVVMSKTIDEEDSDCPGRAPSDSTELQDAFNTLSIVYMSLVTFIAFMLAGVLFFEARGIVQMVSKGFLLAIIYIPTSRFTFVFLVFFLVRCILFLVLYARDITSDIFVFVLLLVCEVAPCLVLWVEVFLVAFSDNKASTITTNAATESSKGPSTGNTGRGGAAIPVSQQGTFSNVF